MIAAIVSVAHLGVIPVAAASAGGAALIWATSTFITGPRADIGSRRLALRAMRPFTVFLIAYLAAKAARAFWLEPSGTAPLAALAITVAIWLATVALAAALAPVRNDFSAVVSEGRRLLIRRGSSRTA